MIVPTNQIHYPFLFQEVLGRATAMPSTRGLTSVTQVLRSIWNLYYGFPLLSNVLSINRCVKSYGDH